MYIKDMQNTLQKTRWNACCSNNKAMEVENIRVRVLGLHTEEFPYSVILRAKQKKTNFNANSNEMDFYSQYLLIL